LELTFLKPWLSTLALPPALGMLIIALGLALMLRYRSRLGITVALLGLGSLWVVSCNGFAVWMGHNWLPQAAVLEPLKATQTLRDQQVQAIVVLGGGAQTRNREYGSTQPTGMSIARLHYGSVLARNSALPLAFSGGKGWAADERADTEAQAAQRWLAQLGLPALRWADASSRDTRENASHTAALLRKDGIERIALVTHAWHMPRAQRAFEQAGLTVLPAPMGYVEAVYSPGLEWLPSADGLRNSRHIVRELMALSLGQ
jgi:uncharacterized SAM-binding protein YcdF (DUF218 family)